MHVNVTPDTIKGFSNWNKTKIKVLVNESSSLGLKGMVFKHINKKGKVCNRN